MSNQPAAIRLRGRELLRAGEYLSEVPDPALVEGAFTAFMDQGCLLLEDLFAPGHIAQLAAGFAQLYGELDDLAVRRLGMYVGEGRVMLPLPLWPPFASPRFYAPPPLMPLLVKLLGTGFVLSSCSVVLALPGAEAQHTHRDNPLLFGQSEASLRVPPYALTLALPLVDLSEVTGTTALYPRSHRCFDAQAAQVCSPVYPMCRRGDAFLMDFRLIHGGTANPGPARRPIIYLSYCRPWYFDTTNYLEQDFPALLVHPQTLAEAPAPLRSLLVRAGLERRRAKPQ